MDGVGQILTNNVAAVAVTVIFIWYLNKRDRAAEKRDNSFNKVIKEFSTKLQKLADSQNSMATAIDALRRKVEGKGV